VYANRFEMNYRNVSLSEADVSLSEAIQCEEVRVQANLDTISD